MICDDILEFRVVGIEQNNTVVGGNTRLSLE